MTRKALTAHAFGAAAAVLLLFAALPAYAGTTIDDAVILDPYDPVPGIGFRGDGCDDGCDVHRCCERHHCYHGCHRGCGDDCHRHARCEHDCFVRHNCDHDCYANRPCQGRDCGPEDQYPDSRYADQNGPPPPDQGYPGGPDAQSPTYVDHKPCVNGNCYDSEKWEHRWRDGTRVGHEWYKKGDNERDWSQGDHDWNDGHDTDWDDYPPLPPPQDGHRH